MPRRLKTLLTSILILSLFLLLKSLPNSPVQQLNNQAETKTETTKTNEATQSPNQKSKQSQVTRIIDGDTIELEDGTKIRYIGINTPEKDQCFGAEATAHNTKLVEGKTIDYETDVQILDRYGRTLAYVWVGDTFVNDQLVLDGYAKGATYPPNIKYVTRFTESEKKARENNVGLWSETSCGR